MLPPRLTSEGFAQGDPPVLKEIPGGPTWPCKSGTMQFVQIQPGEPKNMQSASLIFGGTCSHRIRGTGIFTYIWLILMVNVNVGKYTSPMDLMGFLVWVIFYIAAKWIKICCWCSSSLIFGSIFGMLVLIQHGVISILAAIWLTDRGQGELRMLGKSRTWSAE